MSWEETGALLGMLAAVAAVLLLAWFCTRFLAGRGLAGGRYQAGRDGKLRLLERLPLGREQYLAVVRAGERYFLLGVTASQITLVRELEAEEAGQWEQPPPEDGGRSAPLRFQDALGEALRQRKRK